MLFYDTIHSDIKHIAEAVMKKRRFSRKELKYYARMAAEAYVNDPVHSYATKNERIRKKYVYHFMMERLSTSNREDIIYEVEEKRGICVA